MPTDQQIVELITRVKQEGAAEAAKEVRDVGAAMDGVTASTEKATKASLLGADGYNKISAGVNTEIKALLDLQKQKAKISQLDATYGAATNPSVALQSKSASELVSDKFASTMTRQLNISKESAQALEDMAPAQLHYFEKELMAARATEMHSDAIKGNVGAIQLQRYQLVNFGQQLQDIGVSLAGGQNPFMVMVQQIPQMTSAVGGLDKVGQALKTIAKESALVTLSILSSPWTYLVGGVAAAGAALIGGAIRASNMSSEVRKLGVELQGLGKVGVFSAGGTVKTSEAVSRGSGDVSRTDVLSASSVLMGSTSASNANLERMLVLTKDLSAALGQDMPTAAKTLSGALDGGEASIRKLDSSMHFATATQLQMLHEMFRSGEGAKAVETAMSLIEKAVKDAAEKSLGSWGKFARDFKVGASSILDTAVALNEEMLRTVFSGQIGAKAPAKVGDVDVAKKAVEERERLLRESVTKEFGILDNAAKDRQKILSVDNAAQRAIFESGQKARFDLLAKVPEATETEQGIAETKGKAVASAELASSTRDATLASRLQSDAAERQAAASGKGTIAMREAATASELAAFSWQHGGVGLAAQTEELKRRDAAQKSGDQNAWLRGLENENLATEKLTEAYSRGNDEGIRRAKVSGEAAKLERDLGLSIGVVTAKLVAREAALATNAMTKETDQLTKQLELTKALAYAGSDLNKVRAAQLNEVRRKGVADGVSPGAIDENIGARKQGYALEDTRSAVSKLQQDPEEIKRLAQEDLDRDIKIGESNSNLILSAEAISIRQKKIDREYVAGMSAKLRSTETFSGGAQAALMDYAQVASNAARRAEIVVGGALKSMEDGLVSFSMGTKTAGEAFTEFATGIVEDLTRMYIQAQIVGPLSQALGLIGPSMASFFGFGGSTGGITGGAGSGGEVADFSSVGSSSIAFAGSHADGGFIKGPGGPRSDSILAAVSNGEFIVNASAAGKNRKLLEAINDNGIPHFASGGSVMSAPSYSGRDSGDSGGSMVVNITNNNPDNSVSADQRKTGSGMTLDIMIDKAVGKALSNSGSSTGKTLRQTFGAREAMVVR
ncbi:Bacteriophage lambda, GpH, tail tape measure, N-terminal [uncultured Caudovirales phage]|uniref:Bacteriophage lambda, GpH, tail tape measure, N-terminal n=1 Tax=uncultured Caudovirales phage TaxID=2100421 RepID=A0A6J5RIZ6_9CAUD|nr:Bacteriophage lambda, GpH, tail tape measure, N-terminal [uncultured Caudovirales phage]